MIELSTTQARRLAVAAQGLGSRRFGRSLAGTLDAVRHLGYVQIDSISVVERAHHHVLWNRVAGYRRRHLDRLVADRRVLEYWAHAAAYLPMEDFRFCLPRMEMIEARKRHWHDHDEVLAREILARIRAEGPMRPADFDHHTGSSGMWRWGPVKRAIEYLFMSGALLVTRRENFQKVYDLRDRVVPDHVDRTTPTTGEYADYLVDRFLTANAIARRGDFGHLRRNIKHDIDHALDRRIEAGHLLAARVGKDEQYVVRPDFEAELESRLPRATCKVLSPFDNLVIQRQRVLRVFGFDYQLECYLPANRRRFGYFCLPVLWGDRLAARLDAKADRRQDRLVVHRLYIEKRLRNIDRVVTALARSLRKLAEFSECGEVEISTPRDYAMERLDRALSNTDDAPAN